MGRVAVEVLHLWPNFGVSVVINPQSLVGKQRKHQPDGAIHEECLSLSGQRSDRGRDTTDTGTHKAEHQHCLF